MSFIDKVLENKKIREGGDVNCIPLPFERTSDFVPGIIRGREVLITANSGIGKSLFTKYLYIYWPFLWCRENNTNINVKILVFLLEESYDEFMAYSYSFFLKYYYNITIDPDNILSMKEEPLPDNILDYMYKLENLIEEFKDCVDIEDSISNPTGIYKSVEEYAKNNGKIHHKKENGEYKLIDGRKIFSYYKPYDPNQYVIVVTDHISLLDPEKGDNLHETIRKFSSDYGRKKITKRFNYINVKVQQQSAASEQQQYDNKGNNIFAKLEPTLSELGDNRLVQRDQHLIWGLFAPDRYEIPNYLGYDIFKFKDHFRGLTCLKNRNGRSNFKTPLYFNGASGTFRELPPVKKQMDYTTIGNYTTKEFYNKFKEDKEFWFKQKKLL